MVFYDNLLQNFIHSKMHSLYDVTAVIKNPSNVFCIDCASKMGITMVGIMLLVISLTGVLRNLLEIIPNEVFGPRKFSICTLLFYFGLFFRWHNIVHKFREVIFQPRPARCNFFLKKKNYINIVKLQQIYHLNTNMNYNEMMRKI